MIGRLESNQSTCRIIATKYPMQNSAGTLLFRETFNFLNDAGILDVPDYKSSNGSRSEAVKQTVSRQENNKIKKHSLN